MNDEIKKKIITEDNNEFLFSDEDEDSETIEWNDELINIHIDDVVLNSFLKIKNYIDNQNLMIGNNLQTEDIKKLFF